jgi:hypothetical protein
VYIFKSDACLHTYKTDAYIQKLTLLSFLSGCVYLWYDGSCSQARLSACTALARRYIQARNSRLGISSSMPPEPTFEKQGSESALFTGLFHAWYRSGTNPVLMPPSNNNHNPILSNPVSGGGNPGNTGGKPTIFPLEQLRVARDKLPPGVKPEAREEHLSDADFQKAFGCSRAEFLSFPAWKQTVKRRDSGLF